MILVFLMLSFKSAFSLSSLVPLNSRLFSSSLLSAIRVVSSAYLRLLIFLLAVLIPAFALSSRAFCLIYSAPPFSCCEKYCYEYRCTDTFLRLCFQCFWVCNQKQHCWIIYCYNLKVDMDGCRCVFSCPSEWDRSLEPCGPVCKPASQMNHCGHCHFSPCLARQICLLNYILVIPSGNTLHSANVYRFLLCFPRGQREIDNKQWT